MNNLEKAKVNFLKKEENRNVKQDIAFSSIKSFEIIIKGNRVGRSTLNHSIRPERAEVTAFAGETRRKIKITTTTKVNKYFWIFI